MSCLVAARCTAQYCRGCFRKVTNVAFDASGLFAACVTACASACHRAAHLASEKARDLRTAAHRHQTHPRPVSATSYLRIPTKGLQTLLVLRVHFSGGAPRPAGSCDVGAFLSVAISALDAERESDTYPTTVEMLSLVGPAVPLGSPLCLARSPAGVEARL